MPTVNYIPSSRWVLH